MPACVAYGCTNNPERKIPGLSFHRFPRNIDLRKAWIVACRRKDWQPSSASCLCSIHFTEDQIDRTNAILPRLKRNAVPHVFPGFPSHLQTVVTCAAKRCKNRSSQNIPGITFHNFPTDEKKKKLWVKTVRRPNWTPTKDSKLCSAHFPEEMIDRTLPFCVRLREDAFPVVFDALPGSSHKKPTKGAMKRNLVEPVSLPDNNKGHVDSETHEKKINAISAPKKIEMGSIANDLESEPSEHLSEKFKKVCAENNLLKLKLNTALEENKRHLKKISLMKQAITLQHFEVSNLNDQIAELKRN